MRLIRAKAYEDTSRKAANIIAAQVSLNPKSVLGLAAGSGVSSPASAAEWISNLGYAVFDEAHFFTSDSVFNENTECFLRLSCETFLSGYLY